MTYAQITLPERYAISTLRKLGYSSAAIARELGRHRSTVSREVRRNTQFSTDDWQLVVRLLRNEGVASTL